MKLTENEKEAKRIIANKVIKALDLMKNHFDKFCESTKGTSVPMIYISESIKIFKENYIKGTEKDDANL